MDCIICGAWFGSAKYSKICSTCERAMKQLRLDMLPDRLCELAQADREGRCVALPIKPGTPVWSTAFCRVDDDGTEHPTYPWPFDLSMAEEWGREWFLTREEAEKALEGTKNG